MVCIHCGSDTKVVNSRQQRRNNQVWRRRQCIDCSAVFTTEEAAQFGKSWMVKHKDGAIQAFSRDKLFLSLHKACEHRKSALADAGGLTETIMWKLAPLVSNGILSSRNIAQIVQVALNRFDSAASSAYQAFHA